MALLPHLAPPAIAPVPHSVQERVERVRVVFRKAPLELLNCDAPQYLCVNNERQRTQKIAGYLIGVFPVPVNLTRHIAHHASVEPRLKERGVSAAHRRQLTPDAPA